MRKFFSTMVQRYKLTYFPIKGLAEPNRFLLVYLGEDFEDYRFDRDDWYNQIKAGSPWGKAPILEDRKEGKVLSQSIAISRYLAHSAALCGDNAWENFNIDEVVYAIDDLRAELAKYYYEMDDKIADSLRGPLRSTILPFYMKRLDEQIAKNDGFFANKKLSWADFHFAGISDYLSHMNGSDITEGYPNVQALKHKIFSIPSIKTWVEKRPKDIPPAVGK